MTEVPQPCGGEALDSTVVRSSDGRILVGGWPASMVRLSSAGAAALDRMLAGEPVSGAEELRRRLRGSGMLHPKAGASLEEPTFVVPVRDGGERLGALVKRLSTWGEVVVVDDGSSDDSAQVAAAAGARVVVNDRLPGPAGARNCGLTATDAEYVAFVDADCCCPSDWARPLAGLLAAEPAFAVAAPRVRSSVAANAIGRYERSRSPLDMGPERGQVGPDRSISYVPSAALVARRSDLMAIGGFDEELRFGEDVDLVWRLNRADRLVLLAPECEVEHLPRPTLSGFARQRFEYAGSAAALAARHPEAAAPLQLDLRGGIVWLSAAGHGPGAAMTIAAAFTARAMAAAGRDAGVAVARYSALGHLRSTRHLARAATRDWLPVSLATCLFSQRARRFLLLAFLLDAALPRAGIAPAKLPTGRDLALLALDDLSYCAGLWLGALRERSPRALLPRLRRRPPSRSSPSPGRSPGRGAAGSRRSAPNRGR